MIKIFLLAFILVSASAKLFSSIMLGVNTTFSYSVSDLEFEYNGPGNDLLIFYIKYRGKQLSYTIMCGYEGTSGILFGNELIETLPQISRKGTCTLEFDMKEGEKGTVVIYALNIQLSIDINNQYGSIYQSVSVEDYSYRKILGNELSFSVPNVKNDILVGFEYNNKVEISQSFYYLQNPFEVCLSGYCSKNITGYKFKKGKSYEIKVKISRMTDKYEDKYIVVPGFTFYKRYSDESSADYLKKKLLFISLLLLFL